MRQADRLARFFRSENGTAATEFALIAPILVFLLLGSVDLSRMVQERMALSSILRAGAEAAFRERTKPEIEATMRAASDLRVGGDSTPFNVVPLVDLLYANPAAPGTLLPCAATTAGGYPCGANGPVFIYWRLGLSKTVRTILLPQRTFDVSLLVQIR